MHTASAPRTAGTSIDGGAVTREPGSAWLEGISAMDHGLFFKFILCRHTALFVCLFVYLFVCLFVCLLE